MILALDLYFKLPFGRLNKSTKEVRELAALIGRNDNAVALRLVNFAACDPVIVNSGRTGMVSGIGRCMPFWNEFANDKERLFLLAEKYKAEYRSMSLEQHLSISPSELFGKDREAVIKQRVNQSAFRTMILANYENRCCITGINVPELLVASHIIPWSDNQEQRLNPENGLCLSALYDKAFDCGLIGVRPDYTIVLSKELKEYHHFDFYDRHFKSIEDKRIIEPVDHKPDISCLEYHLNNIFAAHN
jgi:putative restriction endonuclease